jgi:3-oxoacyl-[acyl-carrier-protein] synthase II
LFKRLVAGESGIHNLQVIDTSNFKVKFGGDVWNWDVPESYLDRKETKRIDRFSQFALVAAMDAVRDAKIDLEAANRDRCGVILGSGIGGLNEIEEQVTKLVLKGPDRVSPFTVPKMMLNAAGANISMNLGLRGINYSVATACASANNAMGDALKMIQLGVADVIITGGSEAAITGMGLSGFQNMKALSTRNEDPARASRPFDIDRDGFVLSEGSGILIFEEYEHAVKRGAKIYCEVYGFGASADAGHITQPDDQGRGAGKAMSNALADAGITPGEVDYINAHGTSTPLGDKAETNAVKGVFGDQAKRLKISSTKSQLGHSLGASGGIELVVTVKAIEQGTITPTINLANPDPDCDLDYTPNEAQACNVRIAMSNSFGFGGHNASIVIGRVRA